jgi:hypothetical protein
MRVLTTAALFIALTACRTDPDKIDTDNLLPDDTGPDVVDADGDGYSTDEDCDDNDAGIHPGAEEVCDGVDNDCDGEVDDGVVGTFYADADGDGYGQDGTAVNACTPPDGYVEDNTDCDDDNAETWPGAPERCDGEDNDCDGEIDEDLYEIWYADADGDGYGNLDNAIDSCDPGEGWVIDATDCDDSNLTVNPGAEEVCNDIDDDCDGEIDEELEATWYADADGDGFGDAETALFDCDPGEGWIEDDQDCDDANSSIHPDAIEICDTLDNDCDGLIDDEDDSVTGTTTWYTDADGDGYGDDASTTSTCEQPSGTAEYGGDCDDSDAAYNPGASEDDCTDPADYNCDGSTGYTDDDGDGYAACEDCDDSDAAINADAEELCDNVDNDCDGDIDEDDASDASTWYADADADGYGDPDSTTTACDQPSGYVDLAYATDCDDSDDSISPVDPEVCDEIDNDCDGDIDEGVTSTFYADADGDGYGDPVTTTEACAEGSGFVADASDCDDADAAINPGALEACDEVDNDCDGTVDETDAVDASTWYADNDADGYGAAAASTVSCEQPTGYVADDSDCDDADDDINPAAEEHCDGVDEDCDGDVDEEAVDADTWYVDSDGDGYGGAGLSQDACTQPSGYVADDSDCDDADAAVNPAATEICNGIDDDCDGYVDDEDPDVTGTSTWYIDYDGDGYGGVLLTLDACDQPPNYVADYTDCDDADATAYPGADELCDGVDNDCDGDVDEAGAIDEYTWYADTDGDGYGDPGSTTTACDAPSGYSDNDGDCDDTDAAINPYASEICDGVDNDCDGLVDGDDGSVTGYATWYADNDGDGYGDAGSSAEACSAPSGYVADATDCDDGDAAVNPAASEICDGIDNDCDGLVDDDDTSVTGTTTWYVDYDGDGYGGLRLTQRACTQPSGYVADATDCDDSDATAFPGGTEVCDGADNDCDGSTDEDDATDASTWYVDSDGDSYGGAGLSTVACDQPSGYVADATDCDDADAAVNPAASEICDGIDNDCDGLVDGDDGSVTGTATWYADDDGDGYGDPGSSAEACSAPSGYVSDATDCDDGDGAVNPAASEICDSIDNDCDGLVDDDDTSVTGTTTWYIDYDGDGFGGLRTTARSCVAPSGYVADNTDCDDSDATAFPGGTEVCDGADNDCDGTTDEADATDASTWYADSDGDGYGDAGTTTVACDQPSGHVADATDCDDSDGAINPGASEICDGIDNDCDGAVDGDDSDVTGTATWYADADGDGYGDLGSSVEACSAPSGYVADTTDCDDGDGAVNPGASEICDSIDNDCDGLVDDDDTSVTGTTTWYIDYDSDGFGGLRTTARSCVAPSGYVADNTDCDDSDASAFPGGIEVCDGADNDCDGTADEDDATDASTWYADADGDGYGDASSTTTACTAPSGYVGDATDCDDADGAINPGAAELCDGVDNDCDGLVDGDDGDVTGTATWYADADGDGYGDAGDSVVECSAPSGYVADNSDCDDSDGAVNPAASEICNSIDDDCDGLVDDDDTSVTGTTTWYIDYDSDGFGGLRTTTRSCVAPSGYVADNTDCDDSDASAFPGGTEVCDGADNDCDGTADEDDATDASTWYADADGDGYGDASSTTAACTEPSGYVGDATDCDDSDGAINPGAVELCNGYDDDCDGLVDIDDPDITGTTTYYADDDADGFGDAGDSEVACSQPSGHVMDSSDCDDSDAAVSPDATEVCNAVDDDCDGTVDEDDAADASTWYADNDADGYGDSGSSTTACLQPTGYVSDATDCDDHDDDVHPYASETCDGDDEDCDGAVDEEATDMDTWYADADGDGYGDASSTAEACSAPSGYVAGDTDCDDGDAAIHPGASDDCDGVDNDCDGAYDEDAADADTWYIDVDGDGYGSTAYTTTACAQPSGYVADSSDCDDLDSDIHPGATEICDGVDQDCDGTIDEGATDPGTYYLDSDGDGYGDASYTTTGCGAPSGYVDDDSDCDDADASIHPDAVEICDGLDNDCDGVADTGTLGSGELCAADSCLEALLDDPSAADGTYWVYLDGVATEVECDMTTDGGGWTLIFMDDFETSVDSGWSISSTYTCGSWGELLGGYGIIAGGEIDIDLDCYGIGHSEGWVDVDYAALDSWDGETAYVEVDSTTIDSWSQNNHSSTYGEVCGWDRGYYGSYDSLHTVSEIFTHSDDSMTLIVGSTLDQGATDESFGISEAWMWIR